MLLEKKELLKTEEYGEFIRCLDRSSELAFKHGESYYYYGDLEEVWTEHGPVESCSLSHFMVVVNDLPHFTIRDYFNPKKGMRGKEPSMKYRGLENCKNPEEIWTKAVKTYEDAQIDIDPKIMDNYKMLIRIVCDCFRSTGNTPEDWIQS